MNKRAFEYSPLKYSLSLTLFYFVIAMTWIRYSTLIASSMVNSIEELQSLETLKGYGFVVLSSILLFVFSFSLFRRMSHGGKQLLHSQQRLIQAEREAIAGLLASSVAHDFTNLLTILRLNAAKARSAVSEPDTVCEAIDRIDHAINRLNELSHQLRQAGQNLRNAGHNWMRDKPHKFDFNHTVRDTLSLLSVHETVKHCHLSFEPSGTVEMNGYPILIHQLIMNFVLNAAEATEGSGQIRIVSRREDNLTVLEVHDNGPGVADSLKENIFDAFFTTKKHGTGLGLMSVKSCVDIYKGLVKVEDSPLGGAAFVVLLPDMETQLNHDAKPSEFLNKKSSPSQGETTANSVL